MLFVEEKGEVSANPFEQNDRLAIVASGGGMSASYTLGVFKALRDNFGVLIPNLMIGASGSAPIISCSASGQLDECISNWQSKVSGADIVSYVPESSPSNYLKSAAAATGLSEQFHKSYGLEPRINVDFLVDQIISKILNVDSLANSKTEVLLATTVYETGVPEYHSSWQFKGAEITPEHVSHWNNVIRASMAIPIAYKGTVIINGKRHVDGELSTSVADGIQIAIAKGIRNILAITTTNNDPRTLLYLRGALKDLKIVNAFKRRLGGMARGTMPSLLEDGTPANIINLGPAKPLPTGIFNNKSDAIEESMEIGYRETISHPGINELANIAARKTRQAA